MLPLRCYSDTSACKKHPVHDKCKNNIIKDGCRIFIYAVIRGATLLCRSSCTLWRDTIISPASDVCLTSQNTQHIPQITADAFDCALRGPFNNLRLIRLPPARTLWICTIIFISTSSVYGYSVINLIYENIKAHDFAFVNPFFLPEPITAVLYPARLSIRRPVKSPHPPGSACLPAFSECVLQSCPS